jgi:hypothetical protein
MRSRFWFQPLLPSQTLGIVGSLVAAALAFSPEASAQICNSTASCLAIHPTPGCNSLACCTLVCDLDPTCCGVGGWDAACVLVANQNCVGYPGATASGSCFSPHKNPNCDNAACCTAVCAFDPFCCSESWDFTCTQYAGFACPGTPGVCGTPTAGSCFSPHASGACDDLSCCNAVCTVDPSCCSVAWDALCVIAAEQICQPGCEPVADANAETETEDCNTRSNDPCYVATGGTPQTMSANLQIKGTLGAFVPTSAQPDVDVYAITIPDTDGDGLAKVSLAFASSPKAWAALVPAQACAPMSSAILQVTSELCIDAQSAVSCIPAGNYRVVVGGGTFPQFGGGAINCSIANRYTVRVDVTQACGNPCATSTGSCFVGRSGRGCANATCCASVCAADSFCCDQGWDASCVELAGNLCLSGPPANDRCANAINLAPGPQLFNTVRAALEIGQNASACGGANFTRDVWFSWTSDRQGTVEIAACDPWFDTVLAVYTGSCTAPAILACNDNAPFCGGLGSRVNFTAICGTTYLIRVGPRLGAGGEATISISTSAPVCQNCTADIDRDGQVGAPDLAALLNGWGTAVGDLNGSGTTDAQDLAVLLSAWGPCP